MSGLNFSGCVRAFSDLTAPKLMFAVSARHENSGYEATVVLSGSLPV
jgi:hypothetical protein